MRIVALAAAGVWLVVGGVLSQIGPARAQASFDCAKASTPTEKAICANPHLAEADRTVAALYAQLIDGASPEAVTALRSLQHGWLHERDKCLKASKADEGARCLDKQLQDQVETLRKEAVQLKYETAVVSIPADPRKAAEALRSFGDDPRAAGWLAYLARFEPGSGVTREEGDKAIDRAVESLPGTASILSDDTDPHKDAGLLLLLRLLIRSDEDDRILSCPQAFLFKRHGELAYTAFGGVFGSSMDSGAPYCPALDGLFTQAAWKIIDQAFDTPKNKLSQTAGTMMYGHIAEIEVDELRMSISPQDFAANGSARLDKAEQKIRHWPNGKIWPKSDRDALLAAIPAAQSQTARWLIEKRAIKPEDAGKIATGIVATYLEKWIGWLESPEGDG